MGWVEDFVSWLEAGHEDGETFLELPWETRVQQDGDLKVIVARHPRVVFPVGIWVDKYFASMKINTTICPDVWDMAKQMALYKKLLFLNTDFNVVAVGLSHRENQITLVIDLDLSSLNEEEFSQDLQSLIIGAYKIIEILDLGDEFSKIFGSQVKAMVDEKLNAGESRDDILEFLSERVGIEQAEEFLEKVLAAQGDPSRKPPESMYA